MWRKVLADRSQQREIRAGLQSLNERDRLILSLRFGLGGEEPHTLEEIGRSLGLTRERVRQLESRALTRLAERRPAPPVSVRQAQIRYVTAGGRTRTLSSGELEIRDDSAFWNLSTTTTDMAFSLQGLRELRNHLDLVIAALEEGIREHRRLGASLLRADSRRAVPPNKRLQLVAAG
jgi:hypothetical protein